MIQQLKFKSPREGGFFIVLLSAGLAVDIQPLVRRLEVILGVAILGDFSQFVQPGRNISAFLALDAFDFAGQFSIGVNRDLY